MSKRTTFGLLLGIMILASFLRLYHIRAVPPGLYPDEAMDGNNALEVIQTGHFQPFYVEDNGREGLYVNVLVFFIKALGNKPWVVRLPAAFAGIFTVLGMYFLTKELFRENEPPINYDEPQDGALKSEKHHSNVLKNVRTSHFEFLTSHGEAMALLASFLLATSFWHINFSRIGFRAILAPLFVIWALYFFLKAVRNGERRGASGEGGRAASSLTTNHPSLILAILAGIIFGLGFYTYIAYRVTPLLFLLFIPFFRKYPDFWKKTALFVIAAVVVALPLGIYFIHNPGEFFGRTSEISVTSAGNPARDLAVNIVKTAFMFNVHGDNNWRQNISGAPELFWPVGILFLIGIGYGLWSLWQWRKYRATSQESSKKMQFAICLIFSWFLLGGLPAVISDEGIPHALRSILMLPPAIVLAAIGGIWLYKVTSDMGRGAWMKKVINAVVILFIVLVALNAYVSYFITWAQNPNVPGAFNADYVAIGDQMNALPQKTQKYVVVNAGGVLARGIPVPSETVMFITDSFTTSMQIANHITYLLPDQTNRIPQGTPSTTIFYVN